MIYKKAFNLQKNVSNLGNTAHLFDSIPLSFQLALFITHTHCGLRWSVRWSGISRVGSGRPSGNVNAFLIGISFSTFT